MCVACGNPSLIHVASGESAGGADYRGIFDDVRLHEARADSPGGGETPVASPANGLPDIIETTDAAAGTSTAYTLQIGQIAHGALSANGDHDWYKVDLVAGQTYTFAMVGTGTSG